MSTLATPKSPSVSDQQPTDPRDSFTFSSASDDDISLRSKVIIGGVGLLGAAAGASGMLNGWFAVPAATVGGAFAVALSDTDAHPEDHAPMAGGALLGLGVGLASTMASGTAATVAGGLTGALAGFGGLCLVMAGGY